MMSESERLAVKFEEVVARVAKLMSTTTEEIRDHAVALAQVSLDDPVTAVERRRRMR
jgi:hypothetical protein